MRTGCRGTGQHKGARKTLRTPIKALEACRLEYVISQHRLQFRECPSFERRGSRDQEGQYALTRTQFVKYFIDCMAANDDLRQVSYGQHSVRKSHIPYLRSRLIACSRSLCFADLLRKPIDAQSSTTLDRSHVNPCNLQDTLGHHTHISTLISPCALRRIALLPTPHSRSTRSHDVRTIHHISTLVQLTNLLHFTICTTHGSQLMPRTAICGFFGDSHIAVSCL